MITFLSKRLAKFLGTRLNYDSDETEVLNYGIQYILNLSLTSTIILSYGIITKRVSQCLIWMIIFFILRSCFGGYHAPNHFLCIIFSILSCVISIEFSHHIIFPITLKIIILLLSILLIVKFVPIPSEKNIPLSKNERRNTRLKAFTYLILISISIIKLDLSNHIQLSNLLVIIVFCNSILSYVELLRRFFVIKHTS